MGLQSRAGKWRRAVVALLLALVPTSAALADTEPLDFVRKNAQRNGPDDFVWAGIARDRSELRRLWERFNLQGDLPTIHFERNIAVVAGTGGSSSCPARLHDVRLDRDRKRILARIYQYDPGGEGSPCTDDWVPRTFTVAVAREDLRPLRARDLRARTRRIEDPNQ